MHSNLDYMHQQITVNSEIIAMFLLMQIIRQDVRLNNKNSNFNIFQRYYTKFAEIAKIGTCILDGCKCSEIHTLNVIRGANLITFAVTMR